MAMMIPGLATSSSMSVGMLKRSMDMSETIMNQLLSHLPAVPPVSPPNLGTKVDVRA